MLDLPARSKADAVDAVPSRQIVRLRVRGVERHSPGPEVQHPAPRVNAVNRRGNGEEVLLEGGIENRPVSLVLERLRVVEGQHVVRVVDPGDESRQEVVAQNADDLEIGDPAEQVHELDDCYLLLLELDALHAEGRERCERDVHRVARALALELAAQLESE